MKFDLSSINWRFFQKTNILYGALGAVIAVFCISTPGVWSFILGWLLISINIEVLKKLAHFVIIIFSDRPHDNSIYWLLIIKFLILGMFISLFVYAKWLQGVPFLVGTLSILFTSIVFASREAMLSKRESYARRT